MEGSSSPLEGSTFESLACTKKHTQIFNEAGVILCQ